MPKQQPTVGHDDEDKRLLVIDLGGGIVQGVETNIPEFQGVKVLVLGGYDLGMMSLVKVAPIRVRAEPLTLESVPWPSQYRLRSPRAISKATARRLTRILKNRSTGAAPMNPMNPTIIDPNIVPKINPNS